MPELKKGTFKDLKIGDWFYISSDIDSATLGGKVKHFLREPDHRTFIRVDSFMKAVDLDTGLMWDFRNEYEVYWYPERTDNV